MKTFRPILPVTLALIAAGSVLSGCVTTSAADRDKERCTARGLDPKSDRFQECLVQLETERKVRTEARHRDFMERSANPLMTR
jgi:hypothetical protein